MKRDNYNAIILDSIPLEIKIQAIELVAKAGSAEKVDEHGAWEFGAAFDRRGRGQALNWDLYGYGFDLYSKKLLIVIQVRQYTRNKYGGSVKKSYFLIGTNEDETVFAHAVNANVVQNAAKKNTDVVLAVQRWIFGTDYTNCYRQGDLVAIPVNCKAAISKAQKLSLSEILLEESHLLRGEEIRQNGSLYVLNPSMEHLPATHPALPKLKGWWKVVIGKRASFHNFAAPTVD